MFLKIQIFQLIFNILLKYKFTNKNFFQESFLSLYWYNLPQKYFIAPNQQWKMFVYIQSWAEASQKARGARTQRTVSRLSQNLGQIQGSADIWGNKVRTPRIQIQNGTLGKYYAGGRCQTLVWWLPG